MLLGLRRVGWGCIKCRDSDVISRLHLSINLCDKSVKMVQVFLISLVLASALLAHAGIQQIDFTGVGHIYVLESEDWGSATPKQTVGCLNEDGKFVNDKTSECGTFARQSEYPYTLSSKQGNCTFQDDSQARNTESKYGGLDYAWNCQQEHKAEIYDQLYTIVSLQPCISARNTQPLHRTVSPTSSSASAM